MDFPFSSLTLYAIIVKLISPDINIVHPTISVILLIHCNNRSSRFESMHPTQYPYIVDALIIYSLIQFNSRSSCFNYVFINSIMDSSIQINTRDLLIHLISIAHGLIRL
jgi:hypothetical protein